MGWGDTLGLFNGGIDAGRTLLDVVKKLTGAVDQEMRNDLNTKIGDLIDRMQRMRDEFTAARERLAELEAENRDLRDFNIQSEQYVLEALGPNAFAYTAKADRGSVQPHPNLCAHCFDRKVKSILQYESHDPKADVLKCHACGATVHKATDRHAAAGVTIAPVTRSRRWDPEDF